MSWKSVALGDVVRLQNGYAFKSSEYAEIGYFLMRITNVQQGFISNHNPKYVSIPNDSKLVQFIVNEGDVLMSLTGDVGRVGVVKSENLPAALNQRVARIQIISRELLDENFLFYLLNSDSFREKIEELGHGAAQLNVATSDIAKLLIPLPSLATQQKIVEKLDTIFAQIDRATVATEANVKNAELLYRTSVNQVFETFKVKEVKLKNISSINYGYTAKSSLENDGYHYLRITDIQEDFVEWINVPKVDVATSEIRKYILKDGDIVFARTGATTGKSYQVKDAPNAIFASYLIRVDVNRGEILPAYIKHYFNSEEYWNNVNAGISGAAQGGFNASKLGELLIPYVSLERQNLVVKELSTLERTVNEMKNNYFTKLTELNMLRNSILKQAFSGELVKE